MDLDDLDKKDAQLVQHGLIALGHLDLKNPKGYPGTKTHAAYKEYRGELEEPSTLAGFNGILFEIAGRYVGMVEVKSNATWDDPTTAYLDREKSDELKEMMRPSPWQEGWAYCAAFCEGVYIEALKKWGVSADTLKVFMRRMTPHVVTSARSFDSIGVLEPEPVPGSIWFARHGMSSRGHAGLVTAASGNTISTIEANTSAGSKGSQREGDGVFTRIRNKHSNGRLKTMGFVHPVAILSL